MKNRFFQNQWKIDLNTSPGAVFHAEFVSGPKIGPKPTKSPTLTNFSKKHFFNRTAASARGLLNMLFEMVSVEIWRRFFGFLRKLWNSKLQFFKWVPRSFGWTLRVSKYVFQWKWCAALSSVVQSGGPFGQNFSFNAKVQFSKISPTFEAEMQINLKPAVNRQPGFRRGSS